MTCGNISTQKHTQYSSSTGPQTIRLSHGTLRVSSELGMGLPQVQASLSRMPGPQQRPRRVPPRSGLQTRQLHPRPVTSNQKGTQICNLPHQATIHTVPSHLWQGMMVRSSAHRCRALWRTHCSALAGRTPAAGASACTVCGASAAATLPSTAPRSPSRAAARQPCALTPAGMPRASARLGFPAGGGGGGGPRPNAARSRSRTPGGGGSGGASRKGDSPGSGIGLMVPHAAPDEGLGERCGASARFCRLCCARNRARAGCQPASKELQVAASEILMRHASAKRCHASVNCYWHCHLDAQLQDHRSLRRHRSVMG